SCPAPGQPPPAAPASPFPPTDLISAYAPPLRLMIAIQRERRPGGKMPAALLQRKIGRARASRRYSAGSSASASPWTGDSSPGGLPPKLRRSSLRASQIGKYRALSGLAAAIARYF